MYCFFLFVFGQNDCGHITLRPYASSEASSMPTANMTYFQQINHEPTQQNTKTVWSEKHFLPTKQPRKATAAMKYILPVDDIPVQTNTIQVFRNFPKHIAGTIF